MEPRSVDALARYAALGASRRQVLRYALGAMGGLALARHEVAAQDTCTAPFISCDGMCVYSLTSNEHCGACGLVGDGLDPFPVREPTLDRPVMQNRDVGHA